MLEVFLVRRSFLGILNKNEGLRRNQCVVSNDIFMIHAYHSPSEMMYLGVDVQRCSMVSLEDFPVDWSIFQGWFATSLATSPAGSYHPSNLLVDERWCKITARESSPLDLFKVILLTDCTIANHQWTTSIWENMLGTFSLSIKQANLSWCLTFNKHSWPGNPLWNPTVGTMTSWHVVDFLSSSVNFEDISLSANQKIVYTCLVQQKNVSYNHMMCF